MKRNEVVSSRGLEKAIKFLIFSFFLIALIIKYESREFIPTKLGVPLADPGTYGDFFNIFKVDLMIFISVFLLIIFIIYFLNEKIKLNYIDFIVFLFLTLIFISSLFSEYKSIALWGTYERLTSSIFVGIIFLIYFITSKISFTDKDLRIIQILIYFFIGINLFLIIIYYLGYNLLSQDFFKQMIFVPIEKSNSVSGYIMSTVENQNYLSGFSAFLSILTFGYFLFDKKFSIVNFLMYLLSLFLLVLSASSSGYISFLLSFAFLVGYIFLNIEEQTLINNFNKKIIIGIIGYICSFIIVAPIWEKPRLEFFSFVNFITNNILVISTLLGVGYSLFYIFKKIDVSAILLKCNKIILIIFFIFFISLVFIIPASPDYGQHYPDKIYSYEKTIEILQKKETISKTTFSGREYMWWYTLDLIKEKPITGYGMSTLLMEYPQFSILKIEKLNDVIVSKPHNHYLEILYGSGVFAFSLFMIFFLSLFLEFYIHNSKKMNYLNTSIFFAMIAFLIQGLVNDMEVGTYPIVFIILGILSSRIFNGSESCGEKDESQIPKRK